MGVERVLIILYLGMVRELRIACTVAQMEREGGISPRLSPLAQVFCLQSRLVHFLIISCCWFLAKVRINVKVYGF